jgi:hypothetical protein
VASRVSYIYFDGNALTLDSIDQIRSEIIDQYNNGIPFSQLVKKYTMDHSGGDIGWFSFGDGVVNEFVLEAMMHKKGEIYTLDLPAYHWYYVVLKTYDDIKVTKLTALKVRCG